MSEFEKAKQNGKTDISQDEIADLDTDAEKELSPIEPSLWDRIRTALKNMQQPGPRPKQELAKDRTRSLMLLIDGSVGAVLLFLGVFSTPTLPPSNRPVVQCRIWGEAKVSHCRRRAQLHPS